jgi:hypothetical protein
MKLTALGCLRRTLVEPLVMTGRQPRTLRSLSACTHIYPPLRFPLYKTFRRDTYFSPTILTFERIRGFGCSLFLNGERCVRIFGWFRSCVTLFLSRLFDFACAIVGQSLRHLADLTAPQAFREPCNTTHNVQQPTRFPEAAHSLRIVQELVARPRQLVPIVIGDEPIERRMLCVFR